MLKNVNKSEKEHYWRGIGRRKRAVASAKIFKSKEKDNLFFVNKKDLLDFFPVEELQKIVYSPLSFLNKERVKVVLIVMGGGIRGQAEACRLAISRAMVKYDEKFKKALKDLGYLTRDARKVERKKPGLKKARRASQFSKR